MFPWWAAVIHILTVVAVASPTGDRSTFAFFLSYTTSMFLGSIVSHDRVWRVCGHIWTTESLRRN